MPASAGRVKMPANNRMYSSSALQTSDMWSQTIGHDPYANTEASGDIDNSEFDSMKAILDSAKSTLKELHGSSKRGACKKCGLLGHMTFQCMNHLKSEAEIRAMQAAEAGDVVDVSSTSSESSDSSDSEEEERRERKRRRSLSSSKDKHKSKRTSRKEKRSHRDDGEDEDRSSRQKRKHRDKERKREKKREKKERRKEKRRRKEKSHRDRD